MPSGQNETPLTVIARLFLTSLTAEVPITLCEGAFAKQSLRAYRLTSLRAEVRAPSRGSFCEAISASKSPERPSRGSLCEAISASLLLNVIASKSPERPLRGSFCEAISASRSPERPLRGAFAKQSLRAEVPSALREGAFAKQSLRAEVRAPFAREPLRSNLSLVIFHYPGMPGISYSLCSSPPSLPAAASPPPLTRSMPACRLPAHQPHRVTRAPSPAGRWSSPMITVPIRLPDRVVVLHGQPR